MPITTSLEAINQKLQDAKDAQLEDILMISGSSAITKNQYGVTVVDPNDAASSLIFKPLVKSKLDNVELVKAIDTEVKELKPNIPKSGAEFIPKTLFDTQLAENKALLDQLKGLQTVRDQLQSTISALTSDAENQKNEKLSVQQSNIALANQGATLNQTISDFTVQIQSAVQKSVDESILRASLQAQNVGYKAQIEGLIKQIDSLNSIIEGLQSQLGAVQQQQAITNSTQAIALSAGGTVIGGTSIIKFKLNDTPSLQPVTGKILANNVDTKWVNGSEIVINNSDVNPIKVVVSISPRVTIGWLVINQSTVTVAASQTENIKMSIVPNNNTANLDSKTTTGKHGSTSGTTSYVTKDGITITITKSDGTSAEKTFDICLIKSHPDQF